MEQLEKYREEISRIDAEMLKLFEKRMEACSGIAAYKKEHGLSIRDKKREELLLEKNRALLSDPVLEEYYVNFLRAEIDISSSYQERLMRGMRAAYSGVEGSFAYIAASTLFPEAELVCKADFHQAYCSVEKGECDCAVLPLENSYAGEVSSVLDLAFSGSLFVNQVLELPVRHYLLGIPGTDRKEIKTVISHPQALLQCSEFIERHGLDTMEYGNTALAARKVLETGDKTIAAIASRETARLMGLDVLEENIQDSGVNTTRFAVFSRAFHQDQAKSRKDEENFILLFTVKNEAGSLAQTLNIIGAHGYNMRSLRSRPMKELLWNYYFFVEAEGNIHNQNGKDMMRELSAICEGLKLLGSYRTNKAKE